MKKETIGKIKNGEEIIFKNKNKRLVIILK
jgi:hypothetical protein